jgi:peptide deformylase
MGPKPYLHFGFKGFEHSASMAKLPIILAPDSRLKRISAPVGRVDAAARKLMDDMLETMYGAVGVGLAAPQVGVLKRVIVVDVARDGEDPKPMRLADPEIVEASDDDATFEEGCLSLPKHYAEVVRPRRVTVRYRDETDTVRNVTVEGILSTVLQHEIDHLDGVLFVDHISALKRNMILRKLIKLKKSQALETA